MFVPSVILTNPLFVVVLNTSVPELFSIVVFSCVFEFTLTSFSSSSRLILKFPAVVDWKFTNVPPGFFPVITAFTSSASSSFIMASCIL